MERDPDNFEQAARIIEAFAEAETSEYVLEPLAQIAAAVRDRAIND